MRLEIYQSSQVPAPQQPRAAGVRGRPAVMPQTPRLGRTPARPAGVQGVVKAGGGQSSEPDGASVGHTGPARSGVWPPTVFLARLGQINSGPRRHEQSPAGHSTGSQGQGSGWSPLWFPSAFLPLCRTSPSPWTSSTPGTPQPSPTPPTHCQPPPTPRTPCTSTAASTTVTAVTGPWAATCSPLPPCKQEITVMVSAGDPGSLAP